MGAKIPGEIKEITLSTATYSGTGTKINPTFINYFFGNNGSGKSTVARAIRDNVGITYATGKTQDDYLALVYDQEFINTNIQNYNNMPGVFTMGVVDAATQAAIDQKKEELNTAKEEISKATEEISQRNGTKDTLQKKFYKDCWDATATIRENFSETQEGKKKSQAFTEEVRKHTPTDHDMDELKRMYDSAYSSTARSYSEFATIYDTAELDDIDGADILSLAIVNSSNTPFAEFLKKVGSTEWVRQGHADFHEKADGCCPYCSRELDPDFEKILTDSFDTQYQDNLQKLNAFLTSYTQKANDMVAPLQRIPDPLYPIIDTKDYLSKLAALKNVISLNIEKIKNKIEEPAIPVTLDPTEELFEELSDLINGFNKLIDDNNTIVNAGPAKKEECRKAVFEKCAFDLQTIITTYINADKAIDTEIVGFQNIINTNKPKIPTLETEIHDLTRGTAETETAMKNINSMLHDAGFQGFELQPKAERMVKADGSVYEFVPSPPLHYQVIRPDTGKVADNLSEGEKNFIAFLYFQQLVLGSITQDEDTRSKIVVIDDPVSSMDSSSLFIVSAQIRKMIEICRNNADSRNPVVQGNFIKQIFILTHNAYFHREVAYAYADRYEFVTYYLIKKRNGKSSITPCERMNPECPTEKINVNPVKNSYAALWDEYREVDSPVPLMNVIRQILEYYFLQLCGYEGLTLRQRILEENKDKFVTNDGGVEDYTKYDTAASMLSYISTDSKGINDGTYFIDDSMDTDLCRTTFEMIFDCMKQEQHYNMMMKKRI